MVWFIRAFFAPMSESFLDGSHRGESRARLFLRPFRSFLSSFFFFIVPMPNPSPMPSNISQLRGFMTHHKDTRCVSVAWWPAEFLLRSRAGWFERVQRERLIPRRGLLRVARTRRRERSVGAMRRVVESPRHEKFRLPGQPTPLPSFRGGRKLNELPLHP